MSADDAMAKPSVSAGGTVHRMQTVQPYPAPNRSTSGAGDPGVDSEQFAHAAPLRVLPSRASVSPMRRARRRRSVLAIGDMATIVLCIGIGLVWMGAPRSNTSTGAVVAEVVVLASAWAVAMMANRLYLARCVEHVGEEVRRILTAGAAAMVAYLLGCYLLGVNPPERTWTIGIFALVSIGLIVDRSIARQVFVVLRRRGRSTRRVAIVGTDDHAFALYQSMADNRNDAYDVVGLIGDASLMPVGVPHLGGYQRTIDVLREHECSGAIVSIASLSRPRINSIVRSLSDAKMHVALSTNVRDIDTHRMRAQDIDGEVLMYVEPAVRTGWRMLAKRTLDLVVSFTALLVCLPVLALVAILIKLDSSGPVLFRQERVGRGGDLFAMFKLRTMQAGAEDQLEELADLNEASGPMFKIKDDPRVTRVGGVLRRFSIDEIPQFWNVLRGEMSLVGPRPALANEVKGWDPELRKRLDVPPGLSGLWQVSGRSDASFAEYRRLDLYYVDNWSLAHDLRVIAKTFWVVIARKGAT